MEKRGRRHGNKIIKDKSVGQLHENTCTGMDNIWCSLSICASARYKYNTGQPRGEAGIVQPTWRGRSIEDAPHPSSRMIYNSKGMSPSF